MNMIRTITKNFIIFSIGIVLFLFLSLIIKADYIHAATGGSIPVYDEDADSGFSPAQITINTKNDALANTLVTIEPKTFTMTYFGIIQPLFLQDAATLTPYCTGAYFNLKDTPGFSFSTADYMVPSENGSYELEPGTYYMFLYDANYANAALGHPYKSTTANVSVTIKNHHSFDKEIIRVPATCTLSGSKDVICSYCGKSITETINPKGHSWDEGHVITAPTETSEGVRLYCCNVCGATKTEKIPKLCANGHSWDEGYVITEPTATEEGVKTYYCDVCGATKTEKIPRLRDDSNNKSYSSGNHNSSGNNKTKKAKMSNPLKVKGKTVKIKYKKLKKKSMTIKRAKAIKVTNAQGKVRYKLTGVKKSKFKKYFKVKNNGNIAVKKKLKKGSYKLKIKVTAAGNVQYKKATETITVSIKVK